MAAEREMRQKEGSAEGAVTGAVRRSGEAHDYEMDRGHYIYFLGSMFYIMFHFVMLGVFYHTTGTICRALQYYCSYNMITST